MLGLPNSVCSVGRKVAFKQYTISSHRFFAGKSISHEIESILKATNTTETNRFVEQIRYDEPNRRKQIAQIRKSEFATAIEK